MQLATVHADTASGRGRTTKSRVVVSRDGTLDATRADVDSPLVGGVPVTGDGGLVRQRQVGLGPLDLLSLVGVLIDDGLCSLSAREDLYTYFFPKRNTSLARVLTFIWETSESEGTLPPCWWEVRASSLRISSRVVWKVCSDIVEVERRDGFVKKS